VTRNSPAKLTTLLAGLLLCAAGGLALADPHDSGGDRGRGARSGDSWQRSDHRDERRDERRDDRRYRGDDRRYQDYRRYDHNRSYGRGYDYPRYDYPR
jgi:hypothetical protein